MQQNLRNRISCVLYQPTRVQTTSFFLPDYAEYDYASYYSYDVHGNVKTVVHHDQYFENIFTSVELTKKIDYLYDLVSGSVKEVIYQQTKKDEFRHRYHYDADNRITRVYTSRNGMIWQLDAKYFYYPHGPLARVEVGQEQVQAFDYAYTLHGWLKGVNTNTLVEGTDIGKDGQGNTDNPNRWFGRDAAGFSLGYYTGDYQAIGQNGGDFLNANLQNVYSSGSDLFNGNISHMVTAIHQQNNPPAFTPVPQATTYRYDRLNRIKEMKAYQGTVSSGVWTAQNTQTYASAYKYDFNGNITELERYAGGTQIDDLEYFYNHANHTAKTGLVSNKLYLVDEQATNVGGNDLKQGTLTGAGFNRNTPSTWNYNYDPIGNLVKDTSEGISLINWTVTGKVSDVIFNPAKQNYNLAFRYDPMGNRIAKIKKPHNSLANCTTWTVTWYARDAQGNVMAIYNKPKDSLNFRATEFNIYGSSRIGMATQPEELDESPTDPVAFSQTLGYKVYEFSNHLGNVLTTFSDRKIAVESISDPGFVAYYSAEILSSTDYYPFGFQMPGRVHEGDGYRYGFNSMEKDDELKGSGNSYDFGARIYDPRVGRFLSMDPFSHKVVSNSPFGFASNTPIQAVDNDGDSTVYYSQKGIKLFVSHDTHDNAIVVVSNKKLFFFLWIRNHMITHEKVDDNDFNSRLREMGKCFVFSDFFALFDETAQYKPGHYVEHHNQKWLIEFGSYLYVNNLGKVFIGKERIKSSGDGNSISNEEWGTPPLGNSGRVHTHTEVWRQQPNSELAQPYPSTDDRRNAKNPKNGSENFDVVVGKNYYKNDYYFYIYDSPNPTNENNFNISTLYINYDDDTRGNFFLDKSVNDNYKPRFGSKMDALDESIRLRAK